jgi:hypothetical protein
LAAGGPVTALFGLLRAEPGDVATQGVKTIGVTRAASDTGRMFDVRKAFEEGRMTEEQAITECSRLAVID